MKNSPQNRALALLVSTVVFCASLSAQSRSVHEAHRASHSANQRALYSEDAVRALFLHSDLQRARSLAAKALSVGSATSTQATIDALFVTMETAALQGDTAAELGAAISLCEMRNAESDPRVMIAAARLLDNAANSTHFRPIVPRIRAVVETRSAQSSSLRAALLSAAKDGVPGLSVADIARTSGVITDWAVAGPFGKYSNLSFDDTWPPEQDLLRSTSYSGRAVERFHFEDGTFELPDYLSGTGVLYGAADLTIGVAGQYRIRVESPGTMRVFIDGALVADKDDRLRATPEVIAGGIHLASGKHRVVVKFIPSAAPFRIAVLAPNQARPTAGLTISSAQEAAYVSAARDYWNGDYNGAIAQLTAMRRKQPSAVVDLLLASAWERVAEDSTQPLILAKEALQLAPECMAAEAELAENALVQQRFEEAADGAMLILGRAPGYEPARRILATATARLERHVDATDAYDALVKLHPSCGVLQEASELAGSLSDFSHAQAFQKALASCAPGSLVWAEALGKAGEHARAADAIRRVIAERPLERTAREFLVRELALAGRNKDATAEAEELVRIAPGSERYRAMHAALRRGELPLGADVHLADFADARQFYSAYQRDAWTVLNTTANRHFSGGPAVVLLHDRVAQLTPDGHVDLYVHKITRVLNRDGILQYGEVTVPTGASVLALRTMKMDGTVAEPEMTQHKATVSMPALAAGDAIDMEYVLRYPEGDLGDHADAFEFTFGSFAAPILFSRFVVLSPVDAHLQFVPFGEVPSVRVREDEGQIVREWERNNIVQSVSEVSMPKAGLLPSIRVLPEVADGWAGVREQYRDALMNAVRIGSNVESLTASFAEYLYLRGRANDEQKIRAAYRFVTTRVRQSLPLLDPTGAASAERTLSTYSGNRTAALIAIASAMGIQADLLMARDSALPKPEAVSTHAYTRPLIVVYLRESSGTRRVLVDAETEGIGFGGISPAIERDDALLVTLQPSAEPDVIVKLPSPILDDRSTAVADVIFNGQGDLTANIEIRMGAARSAQMRSILSGIESVNRKHFFEQLAMRIFPGATDASGEVRHEFDPDNPLELAVRCQAPRFAKFNDKTVELDQLAPALGLRKMYASSGARREPLLIDTPLTETATFRIHIPENMRFSSLPADMAEQNAFGNYSVSFTRRSPNLVEVRREFDVPVQVIQPDGFEAFSRFARRIDEAERQRLTAERVEQVPSMALR